VYVKLKAELENKLITGNEARGKERSKNIAKGFTT